MRRERERASSISLCSLSLSFFLLCFVGRGEKKKSLEYLGIDFPNLSTFFSLLIMRCSPRCSQRIHDAAASLSSHRKRGTREPAQPRGAPSPSHLSRRQSPFPTSTANVAAAAASFSSSPGRASFTPSGTGSALFSAAAPPGPSKSSSSNRSAKLAAAGLLAAGFASMALANALWYSAAFLISWRAVLAANSPAAVARASSWALAAKAFAISYAVSQASKVPRGAAILLLAPAADRALSAASRRTGFSKWQLAGAFGAACLGLLVFVVASTVGATAALKAVAATAGK